MELPDGLALDGPEIALALGIAVASLVLSTLAGIAVVVRLPADHFANERAPAPDTSSPIARIARRVGKNLLGVALVLLGALMSLPGVPGQGLLTIVIGVLLLDIPGKRRIERRLLARPRVLGALNGIRRRFDKPALCAPQFAPRDPEVPAEQEGGADEQKPS